MNCINLSEQDIIASAILKFFDEDLDRVIELIQNFKITGKIKFIDDINKKILVNFKIKKNQSTSYEVYVEDKLLLTRKYKIIQTIFARNEYNYSLSLNSEEINNSKFNSIFS